MLKTFLQTFEDLMIKHQPLSIWTSGFMNINVVFISHKKPTHPKPDLLTKLAE